MTAALQPEAAPDELSAPWTGRCAPSPRTVARRARRRQPLRFALVSEDEIELVLAAAVPEAPVGFTVDGKSWRLDRADADYLALGAGDR